MQAESAFRSNNLQDSYNSTLGMSDEEFVRRVNSGDTNLFMINSLGFGLAQWTYETRKEKFLKFMKSNGLSIDNEKGQVDFMIKEFKEDFPGIWQTLCSSDDLIACTDRLLRSWENPLVKDYDNRRSIAEQWYSHVDSLERLVGQQEEQPKTTEVKTGMTKLDAVNKVLNLARAELGYHEKASNNSLNDKTANSGGANWTKYAEYLDSYAGFYNGPKNGNSWCDIFVDFLFVYCFGVNIGREMICQPLNSAGAGCLYSAQYYKSAGRWVTNSPQPGDQIFFTYSVGEYSHTGIVEVVNGDTVTTIEGNTSDQVGRRNYNIGNPVIAGYGRPKWELATNASSGDSTQQPASQSTTQPQPIQTVIKKGAKGARVKALQENLIKLGYDLGSWGADGDFGNDTFNAVKEFQKDHNLEQDGEVGKFTVEAIEKALKELENKKDTSTSAKHEFKKGEIVNFVGDKYYKGAGSDKTVSAKKGKAKIAFIYKGKAVKHPYYVIIKSDRATSFGWVDEKDIEAQ